MKWELYYEIQERKVVVYSRNDRGILKIFGSNTYLEDRSNTYLEDKVNFSEIKKCISDLLISSPRIMGDYNLYEINISKIFTIQVH